jgi:ribonuclease R
MYAAFPHSMKYNERSNTFDLQELPMTDKGIFTGHAKGYGFISPGTGGGDIFVPPHNTGGAFNGDTVSYVSEQRKHEPRPVARVTQVLARGKARYVGTYTRGFIFPLDVKIPGPFQPTPKSKAAFAMADGHRVAFSLKRNDTAHCTVLEIIGHINDPGVDVLSLVHEYGVPVDFPPDTMEEAAGIDAALSLTGRTDLRGEAVFTLDGEDTKDIDDGISLEILPSGMYRLGVHIADVSHYVREGTALNREALKRGNSVYLADRVIPMLPHALSNGICSLHPGEDRLCLSCIMEIDKQGNATGYNIFPTVINSRKRFTYERVQSLLENAPPTPEETPWLPTLTALNELRGVLLNKRIQRGTLQFDMPETKIRLDDEHQPISIDVYKHNEATGIIEECMIVCNETVAAHFYKQNIPFVYRTHEPPEPEKLNRLAVFLKEYGLKLRPGRLNDVLADVKSHPCAYTLQSAMLRSMQQARYAPVHGAHYGLASGCYTHFTSPIRRYADLQTHRIVKASLSGGDTAHFSEALPGVCSHCSATERTAESLERAVNQLKIAQYMAGKTGQVFKGTVVSVESWGIFVMLSNTVEGLVPKESLRRIPARKRKQIKPGSSVSVRLTRVDTEEAKIYFSLKL